mmetsp:Transcript_57321/g.124026  ORF Transcript_57321/g.124026 Transcript_57321/m.124026 type:complete len:435 (-) Transcript_57321:295-1599(-)
MGPMKRPAGNQSGPASKKQASAKDPVKTSCDVVEAALIGCGKVPASVQHMLAGSAASCLGIMKQDRHNYQNDVVRMIGEVLQSVADDKQSAVAAAQSKMNEAESNKAALSATVVQEETELAKLQEINSNCKQGLTDANVALQEANSALKAAEEKRVAGNQNFLVVERRLEKLKALRLAATQGEAVDAATIKEIQSLGKSLKFEPAMLSVLPKILAKSPSDRGSFDNLAVDELMKALSQNIEQDEREIAGGADDRAARDQEVSQAQAIVEAAKAKKEQCSEARSKATADVEKGKEALAAGKSAVKAYAREIKEAESELAAATADCSEFVDGPLAAFLELKEMAPAPPSPGPAKAQSPAPSSAKQSPAAGAGGGRSPVQRSPANASPKPFEEAAKAQSPAPASARQSPAASQGRSPVQRSPANASPKPVQASMTPA